MEDGWMNGICAWMGGWMYGCMDVWINGWMNELLCNDRLTSIVWMDGCMYGWMDRRMVR